MEYLLKASAVVVLFYWCFNLFLKRETFFQHNRWFLFIGLLIALVFPFLVIPIYIPIEPIVISETTYIQTFPIDFVVTQPETNFDWTKLIPIIYGIGFALFLVQFVFQFGSLGLLLLKNPKNKDGIYTYVIVENKISPFSFFKWIVYNPDAIEDNELDLILTHEKVHAKQLHSIDILLTQVACVIFWFNPLIWLYRKEVRQNLEYIADYKTQIKSNSEKEYQRLLLKTSVVNHNISLSNNFYNSLIKERIIMLKKSRSNTKKQWRYLLMLPLLAGLLLSMNTEEVYVEDGITSINSEKTLEFVVTKNTTDTELKSMTETVEEKGGSLVFSKIHRNTSNELTNIFLKLNNHSYGNSGQPIESFIIYKELYGRGGGYVGRIEGATLHFDIATNDKEGIKALKERAYVSIIKKGLQTAEFKQSLKSESIKVTFTKMMTDKSLKKHKEFLKSKGVIMTLNGLKRNKKNEIVDINVDFKTENGSTNYNVKDENGIKSFYFNMGKDGSFGVGAIESDVHIIETFNVGRSKKEHSKYKRNVFIYEDNDPLELIVEDSISPKRLNRYRKVINKLKTVKNNDSIYFRTIDSVEVKRFSNVKSDFYYEDETPKKVIKTGENIWIHKPSGKSHQKLSYYTSHIPKPLIIVDGKEVSHDAIGIINPKHIDQVNILKGNSAIEIYGDKGENGVVVIKTKGSNNEWVTQYSAKQKKPWRVEVSRTTFIDDEDAFKNGTLAYITKYTSDKVLETYKTNLKKFGIQVKYNKLKRNKKDEITSIKISIKNEKGAKSSATWKVDDGIPSIEFGETEGSLIARTSEMN